MRRLVAVTATLIFLALLAVLLRHDLALWDWRQGKARLDAGDPAAAFALFSRAERRAPHSLAIAFDTGVARYRLGHFEQAAVHFRAASLSESPTLKGPALHNLGNCTFRLGEKAAASDRQAAQRLFQEAERTYLLALAQAPGAADTRHNLDQVRSRLAGLAVARAGDAAHGEREPRQAAGTAQAGERSTAAPGSRKKQAAEANQGAGQPAQSGETRAKPGDRGDGSAAAQPAKSGPMLTRDEADALLSEARRGEGSFAAALGKNALGHSARPDRDW